MWSLRLVARIPPDKRLEFTQSVQSLLRGEDSPVKRLDGLGEFEALVRGDAGDQSQ